MQPDNEYWESELRNLLSFSPTVELRLCAASAKEIYDDLSHEHHLIPLVAPHLTPNSYIVPEEEDELLLYAMKKDLLGLIKLVVGSAFSDTGGIDYKVAFEQAVQGLLERSAIYMIEHYPELKLPETWVLMVAAEEDMPDLVKTLLLDERIDPSVYNNEALERALSRGHDRVTSVLFADKRVRFTFEREEETYYSD